jgi:O-antigen/teichoic acid export membrane protein
MTEDTATPSAATPETLASAESIVQGTSQFRSHVGHISRQSGVFFAGTLFTAALSYVFKVYIARVLGAADLGVYTLGVTLIGFFGIFNTLGLPQSAVRFVAAYSAEGKFDKLHALLWRGAGLLLVANLVFSGVLLLFGRVIAVHFYHVPRLVLYLPLFALMMLFTVLSTFFGKALSGYRDLKLRTLIVNFIGSPLNMLAAVLLISAGMGLRGYVWAQITSSGICCVLLFIAVQRLTPEPARFAARPGSSPSKEVWSLSAAMLGIGFLEFTVAQVDKVALGFYRGAREVGIYSIAAAVVVYVALALTSLNQIFAPTIADLHARGEHQLLARLFQSLTKWVFGLTLPLAVVVIVFARPMMRIFGHDFEVGWPILIIGTVGQLVNCGVGSVGYLLLMSGHEKRVLKVQIAMSAVMIVLCAALIPVWGIMGAAAAAALTNIGMNVGNLLQVRAALKLSPYNKSYLRLLPPAFAMIAVTLLMKMQASRFGHDWLAVGVALVAAYVVFSVVVFAVGLDQDDRLISTAIWSRLRGQFAGTVAGAGS